MTREPITGPNALSRFQSLNGLSKAAITRLKDIEDEIQILAYHIEKLESRRRAPFFQTLKNRIKGRRHA